MKKLVRFAALAMLILFSDTALAADSDTWPIDEALGKADAPNTIIEYSSLTCPHCAEFYDDVHPRLQKEWIDTGKARLIFRDFPLDSVALAAAIVAHCSGDRYFSFIDAYFHSQKRWIEADDTLAAIKAIGRLGGLSEARINACLTDKHLMKQIESRKADGTKRYGIDATPTFVINGKAYPGAMSYDEFVALLKK